MAKIDIDDNKINALKEKLKAFGFDESFNKENFDLINHILNDFNKILFSFKTIKYNDRRGNTKCFVYIHNSIYCYCSGSGNFYTVIFH
jgi:hypothetical protein